MSVLLEAIEDDGMVGWVAAGVAAACLRVVGAPYLKVWWVDIELMLG
jgi:hypothetical protein